MDILFMQKKKIAVVTGGSSGIGKAICETLDKKEYTVINADIRSPEGVSSGEYVSCDVTSAKDVDHLYDYVLSTFGIPEVLISNAGQGIHEKITEGDPQKWAGVVDVNLMGALRFVRAFVPNMMEQQKGTIVFVSSTAAKQAYAYGGIYSATKAALNMVAKTLQLEVEGTLKVGLVSPGVVDTPFFKNMISGFHTVEDIGWGSLSAQQIADVICYILDLPPSVNLPEIFITPANQPFSG